VSKLCLQKPSAFRAPLHQAADCDQTRSRRRRQMPADQETPTLMIDSITGNRVVLPVPFLAAAIYNSIDGLGEARNPAVGRISFQG